MTSLKNCPLLHTEAGSPAEEGEWLIICVTLQHPLAGGATWIYVTPAVLETPPGVQEGWLDRFYKMTPEERQSHCNKHCFHQFGSSKVPQMIGQLLNVNYFFGGEYGYSATEKWRVTVPSEALAANATSSLFKWLCKTEVSHTVTIPSRSSWDHTVAVEINSVSRYSFRILGGSLESAVKEKVSFLSRKSEAVKFFEAEMSTSEKEKEMSTSEQNNRVLNRASVLSGQRVVIALLTRGMITTSDDNKARGLAVAQATDWIAEWPTCERRRMCFTEDCDLCPRFNGKEGCLPNCPDCKDHLCSLCHRMVHGAARCRYRS